MFHRATLRPVVRFLTLGVLCAGAGLILPGCIIVAGDFSDNAQYSETRTVRVPVGPGTPVEVRSRNGGVEVHASSVSEAVVVATLRARSQQRLDETKVLADAAGGTLSVRVEWPDGRPQSGEGCTFKIEAPAPNGVHVETSNGKIALRDCAGLADLDTSNGSIRVINHAGEVQAETSNAGIDIRDASGAVEAITSNGRVELMNIGGRAVAHTSNASITAHLSETSPGPIQLRSSNGSVDVALGQAFVGELRASTSNGRVRLNSPMTVSNLDSGRSATLVFGSGGAASSVSTSNGSVSITASSSSQQPVGVR
ncbi:MAG: DUF4097 domain-containing protein [Phycisphaerales bacterium]|nr:DUF4097 domain-containing protein [Phycisphaerales bacterium]